MMKNIFLTFIFLFSLQAFAKQYTSFKVWIKPGTVVVNLADKKEYKIDKGMFARVLEVDPPSRDLFYIYNKKGEAVYTTTAWGIVEIHDDIKILPDVDAETVYPEPSVFKLRNTTATFDTQFNLYFESLQTPAFNSVNGQDFLSNTFGNRFELRTLYNSSLPVNFGLALNYQTAKWKNDDEELQLSIISIGPHFQHYIFQEDGIGLSFLFGAEYAPIYKTSSALGEDKYSGAIFDLGAEAEWSTHYGKWSVGAHYRRHNLTLTSTNRADNTSVPESINMNAIGGMIGYKHEWSL
jgi:hypothetical protein